MEEKKWKSDRARSGEKGGWGRMSQPQDSASIWAMCDSLAGSGRLWSASHASDSLPQFLWQWRVMSYRNCSSFCHEIHHHYSEPLLKDWAWPCLPRAWHVLGRASQALSLFRLRLIFWVIVMDPVSSCAVSLPKSLDTWIMGMQVAWEPKVQTTVACASARVILSILARWNENNNRQDNRTVSDSLTSFLPAFLYIYFSASSIARPLPPPILCFSYY